MPKFIFTDPAGLKHTVTGPEGATQEQAFKILQGQMGGATTPAQPPAPKTAPMAQPAPTMGTQQVAPKEEPGFMATAGADLQKRGKQFGEIVDKVYEQNPASTALQAAGTAAGAVMDVGVGAIKAYAGTIKDMLRDQNPEIYSAIESGVNKVKGGLQKAAATESGRFMLEAARGGALRYAEGAKQHPEWARNVEALVNISSLVPARAAVEGAAKGVRAIKRIPGVAAEELADKVLEPGLAKMSPQYASKLSTAKQTEGLPAHEASSVRADASYKTAKTLGADYDRSLSDTLLKRIDGHLPKEYSAGSGLTTYQKKQFADLREYIDQFKDRPITSLEGLRGIEKELDDKIASNINPTTRQPDPIGQKYVDVRQELHNMYAGADKRFLKGPSKGVDALVNANKEWGKSIKQKQISEVIDFANGDADAERAGFEALYKRAARSNYWTDKQRDELRSLYKKPGIIKKAGAAALQGKTMGLSKLIPASGVNTSRLEALIARGE